MSTFLHLTERSTWEQGLAKGEYSRKDLLEDGFLHCTTAETLVRVANKYYRGLADLVLLVIEEDRVTSPIKWERSQSDGKLHPHIYGTLNPDAVVKVLPYGPRPDGMFEPLAE